MGETGPFAEESMLAKSLVGAYFVHDLDMDIAGGRKFMSILLTIENCFNMSNLESVSINS